jgi:hypothetical protein
VLRHVLFHLFRQNDAVQEPFANIQNYTRYEAAEQPTSSVDTHTFSFQGLKNRTEGCKAGLSYHTAMPKTRL